MEEGAPRRNSGIFLGEAMRYSHAAKNDEDFVSEVAYVMMTLHMHGA